MKNKFIFHWRILNSKPEAAEGETVAEAFTLAGYSGGAIGALDYYEGVTAEGKGQLSGLDFSEIKKEQEE